MSAADYNPKSRYQRLLALLAELNGFGLSNSQISLSMGKQRGYISNLLYRTSTNADARIPQDFVDYFQIRFNVNPAWLRAGEGEMFLAGGKKNHFADGGFIVQLQHLPPEAQESIKDLVKTLYRLSQK